jgi:serine/threonine-protein kinase
MVQSSSQGTGGQPVSGEAKVYAPGDVIAGKYRLKSLLGEGGMGAVWVAENTVLDVDIAIKLIRHGVASPEASERLLQEARAAARLEHPSIIKVFDFGATEVGDPFIAMELLRGESLGHLLDRRGRLSGPNAVRTLLPVASAVCAAHAKGIVHRDLKPDNILLTENDSGSIVPKVVDFGIAKVRAEGIAKRSLTVAGAILGSPDYMCPEQARGKGDIDDKCDVWALAVMLYECLTGQRPFNGENYNALLTSIIEDEPTPTTDFAAGDDALWRIIATGLSKDPKLRPTMREIGEQLAQWAMDCGADTDLSGVSLSQWRGPTSRKPYSMPPSSAPVVITTSQKRKEIATRASLLEIEVHGPTLPGSSPSTPPPVGSTRAEWTTPPSGKTRRGFGLAAVPALVVVVGVFLWFALRSTPRDHREEAAHDAAQPPPTAPSVVVQVPTQVPTPEVTPIATAPVPPPASAAVTPTSEPSLKPSAPPAVASARPRGGHAPGPATGKKAEPGLAMPDRPNF